MSLLPTEDESYDVVARVYLRIRRSHAESLHADAFYRPLINRLVLDEVGCEDRTARLATQALRSRMATAIEALLLGYEPPFMPSIFQVKAAIDDLSNGDDLVRLEKILMRSRIVTVGGLRRKGG